MDSNAPDWAAEPPAASPDWAQDIPINAQVAPPHNDPVNDRLHTGTVIGRLLDAVGQGARNGWGDEPIAPSEDTMRTIGLGEKENETIWNPIKAVNETLIRPAAMAALAGVNMAGKAFNAAFGGAAGGLAGAAQEAGLDNLWYGGAPRDESDRKQRLEQGTQEFSDLINMSMIATGFSETGVPNPSMPRRGTTMLDAAPEIEGGAPNLGTAEKAQRAQAETVGGDTMSVPFPEGTPMTDKAGNLNLKYIDTPEDVKSVLRATAAKANDFQAERGFMSDTSNSRTKMDAQAILDKATFDATTGIPDFMANLKAGDTFDKATGTAARMWIEQAATQVNQLSKIAATTGADGDVANFVQAEQRLKLAMGIDQASVSETARTLQARQIMVGGGDVADDVQAAVQKMKDSEPMEPLDRAKILSQMDDPQQAADFLNSTRKPNWKDMGLEYVINNFLSGPITHKAYVIAHAVNTVLRVGVETPVAAFIGKIRNNALDVDTIKGLQDERASILDRLGSADSTQGEPLMASDATAMRERLGLIEDKLNKAVPVMPGEATARAFGALKGAQDGLVAGWKALKSGTAELLPGEQPYGAGGGNAPPTFVRNAIPGPLGTVIRMPTRVVGAIHSFQKVLGYTESMNALAYRQAASEGLEGDELTARTTQLLANPQPDMMEAARDEAMYSSLMGEPGKFGQAVEDLANVNHGTKLAITFARVTNNILNQGLLERTPVGLVSSKLRADLAGENGEAVQNTAAARMAVGSTIALGVTTAALMGNATGAYPSDPQERKFDHDLLGQPQYSVKIGNWWIADRHLGPIGPIMATGANLANAAKVADDKTLLDGASYFAIGMGKYALEESPMEGVANITEAMNDPDRKGQQFLNQTLTSMLLPYSSFTTQTAHALDPYLRQTHTMLETVKGKEPIVSQTTTPLIDIFGQPVQAGDDMGARYANDPVVGEMKRLGMFPSMPQKSLFQIKIDDDKYAEFAVYAGNIFHETALQEVSDPSWNTMTDYERYQTLDKSLGAARNQARAQMLLLYPELGEQSEQRKNDLVDGLIPPNQSKKH